MRQRVSGAEIDVQRVIKAGPVHIFQRAIALAGTTRVIDQDVEASESRAQLLKCHIDVGIAGNVTGQRERLHAECFNRACYRLQFFFRARHQRNVCAHLCKGRGDASADTLARTGNQRDLAIESKSVSNHGVLTGFG